MQYAFKNLALRKIHGGEIRKGKRKEARPIATKRPMHLTLRSSQVKGKRSLQTKKREIENLVAVFSKQFHVGIYSQSNNGNHLHLIVQPQTRGGFKRFLMALSGRIAQLMTKANKGKPLAGKFWDFIPFTRIVEWGNDFVNAWRYVKQNQLEAAGLIPYQPRSCGLTRRSGAS